MRHDWIFDVLTDLRTYAHQNDLPSLAAQVEQAIRAALAEIGSTRTDMDVKADTDAARDAPPGRQTH